MKSINDFHEEDKTLIWLRVTSEITTVCKYSWYKIFEQI